LKLDLLAALNAERAARRACVLVTDLAGGGQSLIREDDAGSGEGLDEGLLASVRDAFRTGRSGMAQIEGRSLFLTVHAPPVKLVATGAVHISQAMAPMARALGLDMTVIDPRSAFATPERFADVTLRAEWPDEALGSVGLDRYTAFVALTHDPKIDDPGLHAALRSDCFYVGALGSRKTHARRIERLNEAGFDAKAIARIHAPIGLNIGAVSPAEIALSILGEIVSVLRAERAALRAAAAR
jgi:xanthine dehydrogenase accessory factor